LRFFSDAAVGIKPLHTFVVSTSLPVRLIPIDKDFHATISRWRLTTQIYLADGRRIILRRNRDDMARSSPGINSVSGFQTDLMNVFLGFYFFSSSFFLGLPMNNPRDDSIYSTIKVVSSEEKEHRTPPQPSVFQLPWPVTALERKLSALNYI